MLAELIELCLEPKRINDLQNLEHLFPDFLGDSNESSAQSNFSGNAQQSVENSQQSAQIPLPPISGVFNIQQLNINDNYQLPVHQCHNQQQDKLGSNNLNFIHRTANGNQFGSSCPNNLQPGTHQQGVYKQVIKRNLLSSAYCNVRNQTFKNYCCESCGFDIINNNSNVNITNHLTSIISKNLIKDVGWQSNLNTVRERNAVLFNNEYMSDVAFIVRGKSNDYSDGKHANRTSCRVPAHKFVLASGSTVFYAMLYGGLAEKSSEIELHDVEPQGFLTLLKYLYCDDICIDTENVMDTLYCSKIYLVPFLAKACIALLTQILDSQNACVLFSQIRIFDEEQDFISQCLDVIDCQTELAFKSPTFVDIDEETLKFILKRETLNIKEISAYDAVMRWADAECERRNLDPKKSENKLKVLDKIKYLIRFATMSLEEFANGPAQEALLTADEKTELFLKFTAKNHSIGKFDLPKRNGTEKYVCCRFQSIKSHQSQWRYRDLKCDSIQFSTDRKIFLIGLGLYGSPMEAATYELKMEIKRNGKILASKTAQLISTGTTKTIVQTFDHPIEIYPNQLYTASVILDGADYLSYYGQDGLTEVIWTNKNASVTFDFQCSPESNNGTGVAGGQIPELLFYLPSSSNELANSNILGEEK